MVPRVDSHEGYSAVSVRSFGGNIAELGGELCVVSNYSGASGPGHAVANDNKAGDSQGVFQGKERLHRIEVLDFRGRKVHVVWF